MVDIIRGFLSIRNKRINKIFNLYEYHFRPY